MAALFKQQRMNLAMDGAREQKKARESLKGAKTKVMASRADMEDLKARTVNGKVTRMKARKATRKGKGTSIIGTAVGIRRGNGVRVRVGMDGHTEAAAFKLT
mmetsp:Transcript_127310/g.231758  ORF Transcript_127310/g.231758 Transcript_127310/m.231758 type:complete len:102 (-) Transcript_127310:190-495(-)